MGLTYDITSNCDQTAVYWGNPVKDGRGGYTFDEAVEIYVRWEDYREIIINSNGEEIISQAKVFTLQDVDENGFLYLGELTDLDSDHTDPKSIDNVWSIKKFSKSRALTTNDYLRIAYL